jgi:PAS domain-containing protein
MPCNLRDPSNSRSPALPHSIRDEFAPSRLVGGFDDSRARPRAETGQHHERDLQLAVDTIPGLVWTVLPDGACDFLNQRWLDYAGLTLEEAKGCGWTAAVCPQDLDGLLAVSRAASAAGKPAETDLCLEWVASRRPGSSGKKVLNPKASSSVRIILELVAAPLGVYVLGPLLPKTIFLKTCFRRLQE